MNNQINYIEILTEEVLETLLKKFTKIKSDAELIEISNKHYGSSQKKISHAEEVIDSINLCLLLLEANEISDLQIEYENLFKLIMQEESGDSIIIEIRAAAGGDEAALFVHDVMTMYQNFSIKSGWKFSLLDAVSNDVGGYKFCTVNISSKGVYSKLFLESGVHRVQRIPATESKGRIHTSTISVYVYKETPQHEEKPINEKDLKITFCRSSGAGGQHVNTTDSAVRIEHVPSGLVVECQNERSQHMNKASAMQVLRVRLNNLYKQQEQEKRNNDRSSNIGTADRSEKIRTYNYPQNRITDHRFGITSQNLMGLMDGNFGSFINEIMLEYTIESIKNII